MSAGPRRIIALPKRKPVSHTYWFIKLVLPTPLSPKMMTYDYTVSESKGYPIVWSTLRRTFFREAITSIRRVGSVENKRLRGGSVGGALAGAQTTGSRQQQRVRRGRGTLGVSRAQGNERVLRRSERIIEGASASGRSSEGVYGAWR